MRKLVIVGNWKMNGYVDQIKQLTLSIVNNIDAHQTIIIICPSYPYLSLVQNLIKNSSILLGAQDVNEHDSGAHTGEISASMLNDFLISYVIIGHSERRMYYGDDNTRIIAKIRVAQSKNIIPILCVGETLQQRKLNHTTRIISDQIIAVIKVLGIGIFANLIIAYEPIWAIGTGLTATPAQAQEVHHFIRGLLAKYDVNIAQDIVILYGGSVNSDNAKALFSCDDIDGGLVGGASLKADDFLKICQG